ncbi:MND1-interacting protein 1 [Neltuma alba]|uniref:MND1-interacting protein 1 n=1 Tax=Neltuma alba TaxID=207710 RepID=UPI0010A4874B|nr:MND1-interacting protein 1-like [Prosopis alba]XP_028762516.1 MND1-interacting protein 1-like [Prosopis alba]XP_028762517.1 MND1-interacting protein 1-like [Prosopis alba]
MGCTGKEKHIRANRKSQSVGPDNCCRHGISISKSIIESGLKPLKYHLGLDGSTQSPNPDSHPNIKPAPNGEECGWGYCTEEHLEEILLKNLEYLYHEAVSKLVTLGYDEDTALKAVLRNGHCYHGGTDLLTNIMHNSLAYLNSNSASDNACKCNLDESEPVFSDLRELQEYSLAVMVYLLQHLRPHLSKGDAMWCLLMSDLHVGRANKVEIPVPPEPGGGNPASSTVEAVDNSVAVVTPSLCRLHGSWAFANSGDSDFPANGLFSCVADMTLQRDIEFPRHFNLSPSMKSLLKRNVAVFAAGLRANSKQLQTKAKARPGSSSSSNLDSLPILGTKPPVEKSGNSQNQNNQDALNSVLSRFRDLNFDENLESLAEDHKDEVTSAILHQISDLEKQVQERKDWAYQKAMQAARKLSSDLTELKMLRMEREEAQRLKEGKQALEDTTMKRLSEMEIALRKASGQVDRANAAVRRLETENAELKAEIEASKLSASESASACLQVAKREKKCLKRLVAWEKQKAKIQEEISHEKDKILELQKMLGRIQQCQREAEIKRREELRAKEEALTLIKEEKRLKEEVEANNKGKLEALRLKIDIDFQRHKDDVLRLEQELSRLKASDQPAKLYHHQSNSSPVGESEDAKPQVETIAMLLQELDKLEEISKKGDNYDRECIICRKDEVSVVFLPCAHQVMCGRCSDEYGRSGNALCPCCRVSIEQMVRVFGPTS